MSTSPEIRTVVQMKPKPKRDPNKPKDPNRQRIGRSCKAKGSTFERLVAKKLLDAAGEPFTKADCYRTPMSGGHEYAGEFDLVTSEAFQKVFPFGAEMKHRKNFKIEQMFEMTAEIRGYHEQVTKSCSDYTATTTRSLAPIIVIRANGGPLYCAAPAKAFAEFSSYLGHAPGIIYKFDGSWWKMILLDRFLDALGIKCESARHRTEAA